MADRELERLLDFARNISYEAGRLTLGYFYRGLEIIEKADGSPVTVADREAELLVRRAIEKQFPDHGIFGEEHGTKEPSAGCSYTWYIDPIDGTKSFIHGVPLYSCLLGLLREDRSVAGIIQLPALDEQLSAGDGMGCWLNGRRVRASQVSELKNAVVVTTDERALHSKSQRDGWQTLWNGCRFPRSWGDAYGHYLVATGRAEIMLDPITAPYDVAPMPVIMREAGAEFFDWSGEESVFGKSGISVNTRMAGTVREAVKITRS